MCQLNQSEISILALRSPFCSKLEWVVLLLWKEMALDVQLVPVLRLNLWALTAWPSSRTTRGSVADSAKSGARC